MTLQAYIFVLLLSHFQKIHGCCYNYDCSYSYYSKLDQCFMDATFPENTIEAFCWDGACYRFSSGSCQAKKSIGEYCLNAGGNADNNNCVTNLCSSTTNKCELREDGCASFSKCVTSVWSKISEGLAQFTDINGGSEYWGNKNCDNPGSACYGDVLITPKPDLDLHFYGSDYEDYYSINGSLSVDLPDNAIQFDMDFKNFYLDFYLKDVNIDIDAIIGVSNNMNPYVPTTTEAVDNTDTITTEYDYYDDYYDVIETTADKSVVTFDQSLELSDEGWRCYDPQSGYYCDPLIIYRKSLPLGSTAVELEIGMQFIGSFKGSIISDVNFLQTFKLNKHIQIPKLGAHLTTSGIDILGIDQLFDELFDIEDININVDGAADIESSFQFRFGPRVYVSINGIEVYGSIDIAFDAASKFSSNADKGCASGSAGMAMAMFVDFASPPFSIGSGATAICNLAVQDAQDNHASISDINSNGKDSYGTHCQLLMDTADENFGLCDAVGEAVDDLLKFVTGSTLQANSIYECEKLFQVDKKFPVSVNGEICNSDIAIDIGCDQSKYDDFLDDSAQISVKVVVTLILICVLSVI